ncbi:MAG: hypothetical protein AAF985_13030 [Bacteroidota bacterium]
MYGLGGAANNQSNRRWKRKTKAFSDWIVSKQEERDVAEKNHLGHGPEFEERMKRVHQQGWIEEIKIYLWIIVYIVFSIGLWMK